MAVKLAGQFKSLIQTKMGTPAIINAVAPAVDGYNMWFDASDETSYTLSGSSLQTWDDQTGNYRLNGQGTQFTTSDWGNGQPSFEFNRNQNAAWGGNVVSGNKLVIDMGTIFAVMRYESTLRAGNGRNFFIFCDDNSYYFHGDASNSGGGGTIADGTGNTNFNNSDTWLNGINGTKATARQGFETYSVIGVRLAQLESFANNGGGTSPTTDNIGADRTFHDFAGYISELIVYPAILTNSQMVEISNNLQLKWGI